MRQNIEDNGSDDKLFDPRYFSEPEFHHWFKSTDKTIRFYGQKADLKKLRSRLSHYADATKITSKKEADMVLSVTKV